MNNCTEGPVHDCCPANGFRPASCHSCREITFILSYSEYNRTLQLEPGKCEQATTCYYEADRIEQTLTTAEPQVGGAVVFGITIIVAWICSLMVLAGLVLCSK
jgi:hypothetical protein